MNVARMNFAEDMIDHNTHQTARDALKDAMKETGK